MSRQRVPWIVTALALAAVLAGWYLRTTSPGAQAARERSEREAAALAPVAGAPRAPARLEVEALEVRRLATRLEAELSAVLGPVRRVQLAAEVEGRVVAVPAEEHSQVEAGAILVQIERTLLGAAAERADAAVARARANHQLAVLELERQRGLAERRATSGAELDRARSTALARAADLREARATRADARARLDKTEIRAPFAGVVRSLDLEPGAYLRVGDPVAELFDLSMIEIEIGVSDREVIVISPGDAVAVEVDVFPESEFAGEVARIGRAADAETQKYPVQIRVPNADGRLLAGMLGRVRFDLGQSRASIRIPRNATQREFAIDYVFVLNGHGPSPVVQRRRITARAVPFRPDLLEVMGGLEEGERIATSRVRELRDGLPVRVRGSDS